ncbi:MAG TPA: DUF4893 domain-containing protein, partial [Sphingomonas sp.]|nr:DUF4893 domain-containing protein [Sphingomonas sp.]
MTGAVAFRVPLLALPLLAGCAVARHEAPPPKPAGQVEVIEDPVPIDWKSVVTPADQDRLARAEEAWRQGLAAAARFRAAIAAEGALLDPAAALPRAAPSPGPYLCRVVRLGGRPAFAAFKAFDCFVEAEGELLTMVKASGTQRPAGRLWADGDTRMVFLGALSRGQEAPPPYAANEQRDVAGFLERIGPFRWRLAVPFPTG